MFYEITAYNSQRIIVWASDVNDVDRYVDWLNRNREINHYAFYGTDKAEWPEFEKRDDVMSADEPGWDDFMDDGQDA